MKKKRIILIVDDVELNRAFLRDMLEEEYEIIEAANGVIAIGLLNELNSDIAVVLLDAVMPEMDGFEVLEIMNEKRWIETIPVIMISADTSPEFISKSYRLGAIDYIGRPFSTDIVMHRVENTILLYAKQLLLQSIVTEQIREKENNNSLMVDILSTIVEFRNGESGVHVKRIRNITEILMEALVKRYPKYKFSSSEIAEISNAAALHDVGKIAISEEILNKPAKLTISEFEIMKGHSEKGADMLKNINIGNQGRMLKYAVDICRWHHERWDGKGYPDGLVGSEIPVCAQVVAIADVYDALVSKRVYKSAYSQEKAVQMILGGECGAFNADLLDCFVHEIDTLEDRMSRYSGSKSTLFDVEQISKEVIAEKGTPLSSRTVALLEQERIKNQFFASLSSEILFEYETKTDTVTFSDKGAQELNVPVKINNALQWLKTGLYLSEEDSKRLVLLVRASTVDNPIVQTKFIMYKSRLEQKWFELTLRVLWSNEIVSKPQSYIGKLEDIQEEKTMEESLKLLAECDHLTRLSNHSSAKKKIKEKLKKDCLSALLFFDIDNFKSINDTFGHMTGDEVLTHFSESILNNIRSSDVAARIGGDEFIVFVSDFTNCEKLCEWINNFWSILNSQNSHKQFTISMGVAISKQSGTDYDTLLSQADTSLYKAKNNGKNQYSFFYKDQPCL